MVVFPVLYVVLLWVFWMSHLVMLMQQRVFVLMFLLVVFFSICGAFLWVVICCIWILWFLVGWILDVWIVLLIIFGWLIVHYILLFVTVFSILSLSNVFVCVFVLIFMLSILLSFVCFPILVCFFIWVKIVTIRFIGGLLSVFSFVGVLSLFVIFLFRLIILDANDSSTKHVW